MRRHSLTRPLVAILLLCGSALTATAATRATADEPMSIHIVGNHFVDQDGATISLLGVDRPSSEYACVDGYGYTNQDGEYGADAAAIATWQGNAVRVPLNEDCWLGINGQPNTSQGEPLTEAGYRQAIESYVAALHAHGMYVILDLHWSAPGTGVAEAQRSMPDDHSAAFWTSVAGAFVNDPAVVFDAYNEPAAESGYPVSWPCWRDGGCTVPDSDDGDTPDPKRTYSAVGMQALVDAIRGAGAQQPIMLGGLSYANDLSQWLTYEPHDPLADSGDTAQLAASFHNYTGEDCASSSCWDDTIAPVAAQVPVVTGEFGEDDCAPNGDDPSIFDNQWMSWADAHGVSYLAWAWLVADQADCHNFELLTNYSGSPTQPNGVAVHDHLAALAAGPQSMPPVPSSATPSPVTTATGAPAPGSPVVVSTSSTKLGLTLKSLTLKGRRLTVTTSQARSYTGHLKVAIVIRLAGRRRTIDAVFLARRGYAVTLPAGASLINVTVSRTSGLGFTGGSVTKPASAVHRLR